MLVSLEDSSGTAVVCCREAVQDSFCDEDTSRVVTHLSLHDPSSLSMSPL
jgi:hypothetical protein